MTLTARAPRLAPRPDVAPGGSPTGRQRPRRRLSKRIALLLAAPLLVVGLAACEPSAGQETVRGLVNDTRRAHGLNALSDDLSVRLKAQSWANHLANSGTLAHSSLTSGLDGVPWVTLAENVGRGGSIQEVHQTYLASARHKANILDARWDRIGTGHAIDANGRHYTVHVFVDVG